MYDVVIVGGGPAGLNAALVLGRCRRSVLLCDEGHPRNARSHALHGYLTRDGIPPLELLQIGRDELAPYNIEQRRAEVTRIAAAADGFDVSLGDGDRVTSRAVLLATGVRDDIPAIPGLADCYGITVHHCPYCDGWEVRDRALIVLGVGQAAAGLALGLTTWSTNVTVCTNGSPRMSRANQAQLQQRSISILDQPIARLVHEDGRARQVVFANGDERPCEALFFTAGQVAHSALARELGCDFTMKGVVKTDHLGLTCVPGVYVAGDASKDVQFAIVAAAEGAKAAVAINKALQAHDGLAVVTV